MPLQKLALLAVTAASLGFLHTFFGAGITTCPLSS